MNQRLLEFSEKLYDNNKYSNIISSLSNPDTHILCTRLLNLMLELHAENKA
jgi:hypothetical protein